MEGAAAATPGLLSGFLLLQVGCVSWALGSILQKRQPTKAHPAISGAVQQLATGIAFLPFALLTPQHPGNWSTRSWMAVLWLVFFGSIVAYSAFVYALDHLPMSLVTTYNYVNPVVAMFLGWLVYREPFGMREVVSMVFVFAGVAVVKYFSAKKPSPSLSTAQVASE
jgi:drug/metabolite transporter (DMT)-like permease